jgi:hypothetical protein
MHRIPGNLVDALMVEAMNLPAKREGEMPGLCLSAPVNGYLLAMMRSSWVVTTV